jgi:excisionase family DNA binding protein
MMGQTSVVDIRPSIFTRLEEQTVAQRFIQLSAVSEILDISSTQAYALVRSGELAAIKVGGRGQWRVEVTELENYIQRMYSETKSFVAAHPFGVPTENTESTL